MQERFPLLQIKLKLCELLDQEKFEIIKDEHEEMKLFSRNNCEFNGLFQEYMTKFFGIFEKRVYAYLGLVAVCIIQHK